VAERPAAGVGQAFKARVFKVSSLANGEVSLVFHVEEEDADVALGLRRTRGMTLNVRID